MAETIQISTPDGTMEGYLEKPEGSGPFPALLVVQEAFGVNDHIRDVTGRFARQGYLALAPDFYHRLEQRTYPYSDLNSALAAAGTLKPEGIESDLRAALAALAARSDAQPGRVGIVGYCMGGMISFLAACRLSDRLKAAAFYYGGGIAQPDPAQPSLLDEAEKIGIPVLGIFGEKDPFIPREVVDRIEARLTELNKPHEIKVYEGAGHGFFCDARPAGYHEEAAQDAWRRTLDLFARHVKA